MIRFTILPLFDFFSSWTTRPFSPRDRSSLENASRRMAQSSRLLHTQASQIQTLSRRLNSTGRMSFSLPLGLAVRGWEKTAVNRHQSEKWSVEDREREVEMGSSMVVASRPERSVTNDKVYATVNSGYDKAYGGVEATGRTVQALLLRFAGLFQKKGFAWHKPPEQLSCRREH